jgi:hypothetical protein
VCACYRAARCGVLDSFPPIFNYIVSERERRTEEKMTQMSLNQVKWRREAKKKK